MTHGYIDELTAGIVQYPDAAMTGYRDAGLWESRTISQQLQESIKRFGDRPAVADPTVRLSYAELGELTDPAAVGVREAALRPGERVLFQTTNHIWAVLAWYGVQKAGLVPVATLAQHRWH